MTSSNPPAAETGGFLRSAGRSSWQYFLLALALVFIFPNGGVALERLVVVVAFLGLLTSVLGFVGVFRHRLHGVAFRSVLGLLLNGALIFGIFLPNVINARARAATAQQVKQPAEAPRTHPDVLATPPLPIPTHMISVFGTVTDFQGRGIAHATVLLRCPQPLYRGVEALPQPPSVPSNAEGAFTLVVSTFHADQACTVVATAPGYFDADATRAASEDKPLSLVLLPRS